MARVEIAEITVDLGGRTAPVALVVEEYNSYEPSNYCYDPGWICFEKDDVDAEFEYFVSESGAVYIQPWNKVIGFEPNIVKRWEDCDNAMAELAEYDT